MKLGCAHSFWREASATFRDSRSDDFRRGGAHFQPPLNEPWFSYECSALFNSLQGHSLMTDRPCHNLYFANLADRFFLFRYELLEPRILPQRRELRLDARPGHGEAPPHAPAVGSRQLRACSGSPRSA